MGLIISGRRCPVCGEPHTACGPATTTVGVDERMEEATVSELRRYNVNVNGYDTVMSLNEDDAEKLGGTPVDDTGAGAESGTERGTATKATTAANKARTAPNKSG